MIWWLAIVLGDLIVCSINFWFKYLDIRSPIDGLKLLLPTIAFNYLFWYGFSKAPSIVIAWFIHVGACSILTVLIGMFILKEDFSTLKIIGILLILSGAFILNIK